MPALSCSRLAIHESEHQMIMSPPLWSTSSTGNEHSRALPPGHVIRDDMDRLIDEKVDEAEHCVSGISCVASRRSAPLPTRTARSRR